MKCKEIPTRPILLFLAINRGGWCTWGDSDPSIMPSVQSAMPTGTPPKLQLAKMRQLIKRGLVSGCGCGCRGDFEITKKGDGFIEAVTKLGQQALETLDFMYKSKQALFLGEKIDKGDA